MLTGEYNFLLDHMWLTNIIAFILLILPFICFFFNEKWLFGLYTISIIANLPIVFILRFNYSYELLIVNILLIKLLIGIYKEQSVVYSINKDSLYLLLFLLTILFFNLLTSFFNFNHLEYFTRLIQYFGNIFLFIIYTYFFNKRDKIESNINAMLMGALILVGSMVVEMIYGYYALGVRNMRPAGLLLDPNVCAFSLNVCLMFSFFKRKNASNLNIIYFIVSRIFILFGVFLTVSRSGYIAAIFILLYMTIDYSRSKEYLFPVLVSLIFILFNFIFLKMVNRFWETIYNIIDLKRIFPKDVNIPSNNPITPGEFIFPQENERLTLIKTSVLIIYNNFLFGVGIGNVPIHMKINSGINLNSHNMVLQLLAESGIIMLIVIVVFIYYLFIFLKNTNPRNKWFFIMVLAVIIIEGQFNHNLLNIDLIWLILSFVLSIHLISSFDNKLNLARTFS